MLRVIIGTIVAITAIVIGLYLGVVWAFIGGIIQIITEIRADNLNEVNIAWGIAKVIFASFITTIIIWPGIMLASIIAIKK